MLHIDPEIDELADAMREMTQKYGAVKAQEILLGYQEMAADEEREAEALEWCEAFIGEDIEDEDMLSTV